MNGSTRIDKLLLACALAVCAAAFAVGGQEARASATEEDYCQKWYKCPGGPDNCLTDSQGITCYKTVRLEEEAPLPD